MSRRLAAIVALVVGTATLALGIVVAVNEFPRGLGLLASAVVAAAAAWYGVLRRGPARVAGGVGAALAVVTALGLLLVGGDRFVDLLVVVGVVVFLAALRATLVAH